MPGTAAHGRTRRLVACFLGAGLLFGSRVLAKVLLQYTRSVATLPGAAAVDKLEPELYLNVRLPWFTLSFDWDTWWDYPSAQLGQTLKVGASQALGSGRRWVAGVSYLFPLNDYARATDMGTFGLTLTRHLGGR